MQNIEFLVVFALSDSIVEYITLFYYYILSFYYYILLFTSLYYYLVSYILFNSINTLFNRILANNSL